MKVFILCMGLLVSGCGKFSRLYTAYTGNVTFKCIEGVRYIQSDSGLTLLVDIEGKPKSCEASKYE
jgi:hypothetical protein